MILFLAPTEAGKVRRRNSSTGLTCLLALLLFFLLFFILFFLLVLLLVLHFVLLLFLVFFLFCFLLFFLLFLLLFVLHVLLLSFLVFVLLFFPFLLFLLFLCMFVHFGGACLTGGTRKRTKDCWSCARVQANEWLAQELSTGLCGWLYIQPDRTGMPFDQGTAERRMAVIDLPGPSSQEKLLPRPVV